MGHVGLNKLVEPYEDKSAVTVATFAFCAGPGEEPILFQGRTEVSGIYGGGYHNPLRALRLSTGEIKRLSAL